MLASGRPLVVQASLRAAPAATTPRPLMAPASRQMRCKATNAAEQEPVPSTWGEVQRRFFSDPCGAAPACAILAFSAARLQTSPVSTADAAVAAGVVAFWLLQEWFVHKYLLHSEFDWMGKNIHKGHHETQYFHVSLDSPQLIIGVMGLAAAVFYVVFQGGPLFMTASVAYFASGLFYEWLHFVAHTRWVPPTSLGPIGSWLRAVRRHHMLHHLRNEDYWLSFSAPSVDGLFGTLPRSGSSVPQSDMARRAHIAEATLARQLSSGRSSSGGVGASVRAAAAEKAAAAAAEGAAVVKEAPERRAVAAAQRA